jgi:hypothetical protein
MSSTGKSGRASNGRPASRAAGAALPPHRLRTNSQRRDIRVLLPVLARCGKDTAARQGGNQDRRVIDCLTAAAMVHGAASQPLPQPFAFIHELGKAGVPAKPVSWESSACSRAICIGNGRQYVAGHPLDPLFSGAVIATLGAGATSVADSNHVCVVAEEILAPACAAAAARTPDARRGRNRRRTT